VPPAPRLLALDVDGTLLTSRHEVTDAVAAAVRRARGLGVEVVLTTSRPPRALWPILARLGLVEPAVFVASQGALTGSYSVQGTLRVLERRPMPAELARQVLSAAARLGLSANWFAGERWIVPRVDALVEQEARIVGVAPAVGDPMAAGEGPDKILLLAPEVSPDQPGAAVQPGAADLLGALDLPEGLAAEASTPTHLEITAAGVDKGDALAALCAQLGVAPEQVAAVGDGANDLAMLRFAGIAVAPANAPVDVRAAADLVAPSNDEDAVAWVVAHLLGPGEPGRPEPAGGGR
jgi:Cof subfamily protein (haloacid dehalogenase superfamily)